MKLNVLSLFDGISCGRVALDKEGIEVNTYYASEIEEDPIKVSKRNYPDIVHIGDVNNLTEEELRKLPKIDLILAGSPCFVEGTLITTNKGLKPIEEIGTNDIVLTHENRFKKVVVPMKKYAYGIYNIKVQCAEELTATEEHPFYVRERTVERVLRNGKIVTETTWSEPKWKKAKDLKKNTDFVGFAENKNEINSENLTKEECWLIGRYIADGYVRNNKRKDRKNSYNHQVIYCIGKHKLKDFQDNIKDYYVGIKEDRTSYKGYLINERMMNLCIQCGRGAENKKIPQFIMDLPKEYLKVFLDGYMSGDGSEKDGKFKATSISRILINQLGQVVQKVHQTPYCIYYTKRKPTTVIEGRVVNQKDTWTIEFKKKARKQDKAFYMDGMLWCPVKKIDYDEDWIGEVYNFEVEDDNSYVANNCTVHNCQGFSRNGKGLSFDDPRSKLFFKFINILNWVKENNNHNVKFLLENVEMKKEWESVIDEYIGQKAFKINSTLVAAQKRPRLYWTNIEGVQQPRDKGINLIDILEDNVDDSLYVDQSLLDSKPVTFEYSDGTQKTIEKFIDIQGNKAIVRNATKQGYLIAENGDSVNLSLPNSKTRRGRVGKGKTNTLDTQCNQAVFINGKVRRFTITELERLQTLPDGYTEGIPDGARKKAIGNGWTVDAIAHILSYLK
jgi:site-specific DNA-cytosine methylase